MLASLAPLAERNLALVQVFGELLGRTERRVGESAGLLVWSLIGDLTGSWVLEVREWQEMDAMSVEILALLEAGRLLHDDLEITFIVIVRAWSTFHALEFGAYRVRRDQASVDPLARLGNLAVQHLCALKLR